MVLEERSDKSEPKPRIVMVFAAESSLDDVLLFTACWSVMTTPGLTTNGNGKKDVETSDFRPTNTNKKSCM